MLIGIDGNEANVKEKVGVHQYAFDILCSFYELRNKLKSKHRVIVYLKDKPRHDLPKQNSGWTYKVVPGRGLWIVTKLMPNLIFDKPRPDILFVPHHYLPLISPVPSVCTIHDLGYLRFSEQFRIYDFWQLRIWTAISIFISKAIIAVSNSAKEDIVRHYPFASKKITVVHHGYDKERFNTNISQDDVRRVKKKYSIVNDYVLFLSTLKPSKNIESILSAWKTVKQQFPGLKLVIAGKKGWLFKPIFEKVKGLEIEKDVIFTDFVAEDDKPALLKGAKVLVSPSFWEGFGLHVLEAMASGTPVVVSKVASLPEVVGRAGVFVDPYNIEDIAKGIKKVLSMDRVEYNRLVKKGLKQAEKFSWEKAARETISVLERTAKL